MSAFFLAFLYAPDSGRPTPARRRARPDPPIDGFGFAAFPGSRRGKPIPPTADWRYGFVNGCRGCGARRSPGPPASGPPGPPGLNRRAACIPRRQCRRHGPVLAGAMLPNGGIFFVLNDRPPARAGPARVRRPLLRRMLGEQPHWPAGLRTGPCTGPQQRHPRLEPRGRQTHRAPSRLAAGHLGTPAGPCVPARPETHRLHVALRGEDGHETGRPASWQRPSGRRPTPGAAPGRGQASLPWQALYFLPLPHGQGSLRPTRGRPPGPSARGSSPPASAGWTTDCTPPSSDGAV